MVQKGRVLIRSKVFPYSEKAGGGAENLLRNIASALTETGWKVNTLSPCPETDSRSPEQVTCQFFEYPNPSSTPTRLLNSVRGTRTFKNLVQTDTYDVILDDVSHLPFYPAHFLCDEDTTNALFLHTGFFDMARQVEGPIRGTIVEAIERTLPYLNSPEIICAGPSTRKQVETHTSYGHTSILRPCINIDQFDYEFDSDSKTILSLGRLTHRKNVSCLIRAWRQIEQLHPDYELVIAGSGPKENELHNQAQQANLDNIKFKGFVEEEEKLQLYRESLVFVLPSLLEGYVTTGLEALASGTPVVGCDTPGINDYISPGEHGYLFPTNDADALANSLDHAITNSDELEPIAKNARELAEDHSYERFRERANTLFTELSEGTIGGQDS